ncbi:putative ferric-chelate reductase 1 homolog [Trichonephila inaurata madagascariensis]|uniref:Putative ferric-chelate reductase 1 homolog n=1 Tax=Trichonephila inaurata madagascariensis TaxID=2747483 RepID=A0A8X6YMP3_9ARAC|nr:putative ferric-chelate reductase 1 homolog [Trichonephila inaurata madagascariensis]
MNISVEIGNRIVDFPRQLKKFCESCLKWPHLTGASIPQGQTFYFCCNFPRTRNRVHRTSLPHPAIASSFPSTHNSSGCLIQALKMTAFAVVFLIGISLLGCNCRPDGAPKTACSSLTPVHSGIKPQRESSPYSVSVTKNGNKVRVRIFSSVGEEIEGFALQARSSKDRHRLVNGRFTTKDGISKTIDCLNGKENTLTQVNPTPKTEIVTEWLPSISLEEDVVFRATVAKTFAIFWTEIDSLPVRIKSDVPAQESSRSERKESKIQKMYEGCFESKGCFGTPGNCINNQDCLVLLSYTKQNDDIAFKLNGLLDNDEYMAFGLSNDPLMGDDNVFECVKRKGSLVARQSWNDGKSNVPRRELPRDSYEAAEFNGYSSCQFLSRYVTEANGKQFNLSNSTYYVLLAKGPMRNERLGYHTQRLASQQSINFTAFQRIDSETVSDAVKVHGLTEETFLSNNSESDSFSTEATFNETTSYENSGSEFSSNTGVHSNLDILLVLTILGLLFL